MNTMPERNMIDGSGDKCGSDKMGDLKMREDRITDLYHSTKDLTRRTSNIADRVYGSLPEACMGVDTVNDPSGSMGSLDVQLDMLEGALRGAHDQIARLQDL
jgi:hypothetical protein